MSNSPDENEEEEEINLKILLLGDSTVGKTTLILKYVDGFFPTIHVATIGVEFKKKKINIDGININLQIWDTAGQERFRGVTKTFLKGAHGIILIYDITNQKTFENVKNWINQIKEEVSNKVTIILVGNKIDDEDHRVVSTEQGEKMANDFGLMFFECSAKSGVNIDSTFNELVKKTVENYSKVKMEGEKLTNKKGGKKGCC